MAFGFRNLANYERGPARRCGACCGPGEWRPSWNSRSRPIAVFGALYHFYSRRILPVVGGALSGSRDAYRYLPESVRKFPAPEELAE